MLGSIGFTARDWTQGTYSIVNQVDAMRSVEAARVFRLTNADWIISSGGKLNPDDPHEASGMTIRAALIALGVPGSKILGEADSRNTHENALVAAAMLQSLSVDHVVLVTSDHMRRSLAFRGAHRAIPAIYVDLVRRNRGWTGSFRASSDCQPSVMHEAIRIAYYIVAAGGFR